MGVSWLLVLCWCDGSATCTFSALEQSIMRKPSGDGDHFTGQVPVVVRITARSQGRKVVVKPGVRAQRAQGGGGNFLTLLIVPLLQSKYNNGLSDVWSSVANVGGDGACRRLEQR